MVSKTKILHLQEPQEALQHKMQPLLHLYLEGHKFTSFCNYSVLPSFNNRTETWNLNALTLVTSASHKITTKMPYSTSKETTFDGETTLRHTLLCSDSQCLPLAIPESCAHNLGLGLVENQCQWKILDFCDLCFQFSPNFKLQLHLHESKE